MPRNGGVPKGLEVGGRQLWASVTAGVKLGPGQDRILLDACREADLIDAMVTEQDSSPLLVKGSTGQLVAAPLVSELRQHRAALSALLKALRLPATSGDEASEQRKASESARAAAREKWDQRRAS